MGKRGGGGGDEGSYNPRAYSNRIQKVIEKEKNKQHQRRVGNSLVSNSVIPNSSSASTVSGDKTPYDGYIFMCNGKTKTDCFKYRVFGLPAAKIEDLNKIHPEMKLFLFDFDLRLLYGIFLPASKGELSIEPTAFGGRFSAQVYVDCLPLPESVFKPIIRDIYQGPKFRQELSKEHVQNLISLFRPVAMSPSKAVVSLPAAVSLEETDKPPGFEVYSEPGPALSDLLYQDLARPPRHSHHMGEIEKSSAHVSHASATKLQSVSLLPVRAHPYLQQYYATEAHPAYLPALPEQELYKRYVALPRDDQVSIMDQNAVALAHSNFASQLLTPSHGNGRASTKSLSAAYWISVANESLQKEMYPPCQSTPLANTSLVLPSQTPPAEKESSIISRHRPTENDESSLTVASAVVVQPPVEDCPTPLPTSSSSLIPGNLTTVTSQDPNQVYYGLSQWQVASSGFNTDNAPTSVLETGANHYYYDIRTGTHNVPVQDHDSTTYYSSTVGVQVQEHNPTAVYYSANSSIPAQDGNLAAYYSANSSISAQDGNLAAYYSATTGVTVQAGELAAYYPGTTNVPGHDPSAAYYYANTSIPAQAHDVAAYYAASTGIPGQAHEQRAYCFSENSYGHTQVPSSSQVPAYWDPNQVGVAYFPQSMVPSGNNSSSVGGGEHMTVSLAEAAATMYPI